MRLEAKLADLNIEAVSAPLLEIVYQHGPEVDLNRVQALVFTSVNGVRAFAKRSSERQIPVLCVGDATAREAICENFEDVKSAGGDVSTLSTLVKAEMDPSLGEILHVAGRHVAGDLAQKLARAGFIYRRDVLYASTKAQDLPHAACVALTNKAVDGVLFYSPRTVQAFVKLVERSELTDALKGLTAYCLSPAVGHELSSGLWKDIKIAANPTQESLLKLL